MRRMTVIAMTSAALVGLTAAGIAAVGASKGAEADLRDREGRDVGQVWLRQTPNGVIVQADVRGLPAGVHGFHLHAVGKCEAPAFTSAGGHFNPHDRNHGILSPAGPHAGDLPNIHIAENGKTLVETFARDASFEHLFDADGAAVVIHASADDYMSDPAGNAGDRIACGVIER